MALRGDHINDQHIIYTKANRVKVNVSEKMRLNLDGEYGGIFAGRIREPVPAYSRHHAEGESGTAG